MICPYCKKEMGVGEIISGHAIVAPKLYIDEDTQISLIQSMSPVSLFVGDKLQCHYCLDCRKVILDIPEKTTKKRKGI